MPTKEKLDVKTPHEDILYALVINGEWVIDANGRIWKGERRVERQTPQGYLQVRKMSNGVRLHTGAHRLVYRHFHGEIPVGMAINHKNGIKIDNRPENLEIATYSQNMKHSFLIGLRNQNGERNPAAKLTNKEVLEIRTKYANGGITQAALAQCYGVAFQTISDIVRGDSRKEQPGEVNDYASRRTQQLVNRDEQGRFHSKRLP